MSGYPRNNKPIGQVITGTTYTISEGDFDNCLVFTNGSAIAVTLQAPGTAGGRARRNIHAGKRGIRAAGRPAAP